MPESGATSFQIVFRQAELIEARELERGVYFGDGPTSEQIAALVEAVRPIGEAESPLPAALWGAFRIAVDVEMSWLFPEADPLAEPMTSALRDIQTFTGTALRRAMPEMSAGIQKYASLSIVVKAARKTEALRGNRIIWRLVLARALHRVGKFLSG